MTVMCLTNTVAANFTANVLLSIGARPAMIEDPGEAAEFARLADATLVNVGTLTLNQQEVMRAAVDSCNASHRPWVLDPVAVHALAFRRQFVEELLSLHPTAIRGNCEEIDFLLQKYAIPSGSVPTIMGSVPMLATGAVDRIYLPGRETITIEGGVEMLQRVTATGCAQGAVVAAFLGWGQSPDKALVSASKLVKTAGKRAFERTKTPGSFQIALLDELAKVTEDSAWS